MNCPKCKMEMVAVTGADGWFCVLCSIVHATVTVDNNQAKREAGMIDKEALYNDLVEAFIGYQYRLDNPFPSKTETPEVMVLRFRTDPLFHNKVESLVQGVMNIVLRHSKN